MGFRKRERQRGRTLREGRVTVDRPQEVSPEW